MYDCSNAQSLEELDKWVEDLIFHVGQQVIMVIVGVRIRELLSQNKTDIMNFDPSQRIDEMKEKYEIALHFTTNHKDSELKAKFDEMMNLISKSKPRHIIL